MVPNLLNSIIRAVQGASIYYLQSFSMTISNLVFAMHEGNVFFSFFVVLINSFKNSSHISCQELLDICNCLFYRFIFIYVGHLKLSNYTSLLPVKDVTSNVR